MFNWFKKVKLTEEEVDRITRDTKSELSDKILNSIMSSPQIENIKDSVLQSMEWNYEGEIKEKVLQKMVNDLHHTTEAREFREKLVKELSKELLSTPIVRNQIDNFYADRVRMYLENNADNNGRPFGY